MPGKEVLYFSESLALKFYENIQCENSETVNFLFKCYQIFFIIYR